MEKLGTNKLNMQKLLAPAALVILYIVFSIFGNNFLSLRAAPRTSSPFPEKGLFRR